MHRAVETGMLDALDPEQERQVQTVLDTITPMIARATGVHREVRLDIKLSPRQSTFGTCDLRLCGMDNDATKEILVDYKFGRLPVPPASRNRQAWAYACGVFQDSPTTNEVTVVFIQPRLESVDVVTFTRAVDYPRMIESLATLVKECKVKAPKRTACKACEYCAHISKCPAVASVIEETVTPLAPVNFPSGSIIDLTAVQVDADALPLARIAEAWAKSIKERAKAMLESGTTMAGHELGQRSAPQKLTGSTEHAAKIAAKFIPIDVVISACVLSVSQLKLKCKEAGHPAATFSEIRDELVTASLLEPAENQKQSYLKRK